MRPTHGVAHVRGRGGVRAGRGWWTAGLAALALAACSDSSAGPEETPAVALVLSGGTVNVVQGQAATVTATVTRSGGFAGAVALTLEGAPAGLTGAFAPASLTGGTTSSTLTLTAAAGLAEGTYNVTVRAAGTGVAAKTAPLAVTVAAQPAIALTVTFPPGGIGVIKGEAAAIPIAITRTGGYTGAVDLALEGTPAGVTGTFTPAQLGTGVTASSLGLSVSSAAVAGTYQLTIRAHGTGVADRTATMPLTVIEGSPQGFTLALAPNALTVQQGGSGTVKLTATRAGGFTGPITLSAGGAPGGVTTTFPATTLAGDTMTLAFSVAGLGSAGGTPLPGVYVLSVSGQAPGLPTQSVQLPLTVTAAPGGFDVTVSPAAVSLAAGATGRTAVRIARSGGYTGAVTLSVAGAPAGLTATVAETMTLADSVELSLAAAANLVPGAYPLKVIGQVAGLAPDTTALNVTVTAAPAGGFSVALNPANVTVTQGGNATSALAITRTGSFTGAVTLAVTGAPNGLTVTLDSTSVGGAGTTLRLAAAANLAPGSYTLTVRGNAAGLAEQTAQLGVTVNPGAVGGTITLRFCADDLPQFVAYQSGNGAWTRVNASGAGNNEYQVTISGRGGVAYVDAAGETNVFYASEAEFTAYATGQCIDSTDPAGGKTLTGSVTGMAQFSEAQISLGSASASSGPGNYTLLNVPDGALDLLAAETGFNLFTGALTTSKFILRRGLDLPNQGVIPVLDFGSAEAFAPASANLTVNGLNTGESAYVALGYQTSAGGSGELFGTGSFYFAAPFTNTASGSTSATGAYQGIPAAKQLAGDLHLLFASATAGLGAEAPTRSQIRFFTQVTDRAVALGPVLAVPAITSTAGQNLYLRVTLPAQPEYANLVTASFSQGQPPLARSVTVSASAGYYGAGFTTWDLAIPDLSGLGFPQGAGLNVTTTDWTVTGASYAGIQNILDPTPTNGTALQFATRSGSYTP